MTDSGQLRQRVRLGLGACLASGFLLYPLTTAAAPGLGVQVEVFDSRAEPAPDAEAWLGLLSSEGAGWQRVVPSPSGARAVRLEPDARIRAVVLIALADEHCGVATRLPPPGTAFQGRVDLRAVLAPLAGLRGLVLSATGKPAGGIPVTARLSAASFEE